ncbi:hypothetical protein GCM10020000_80490 [Streptomyces olivoverticillatus]
MKRNDPHVYPGEFVTCVYNPDRALCRRTTDGEGPSLPDCQPLKCRNVALSRQNKDALTTWLAQADGQLARADVVAPYVRHRLEHRRQEVADLLTAHTTEGEST